MAVEIVQNTDFTVVVDGLAIGKVQEVKWPEVTRASHVFNNGVDRTDDKMAGKVSYSQLELKMVVFFDDRWAMNTLLTGEKVNFSISENDESGNAVNEYRIAGIATKLSKEDSVATGDGGIAMESLTIDVTEFSQN